MWHSGREYSKEEMEILRELEYDLFMFDPGFRSSWKENFEEYFKALFDENLWDKHHNERSMELDQNMSFKMAQDPEFSKFMQHQALIDAVLLDELPFDNAPIDVQQEVLEIRRESEELSKQSELHERLGIPFVYEQELDPWQKDSLFNRAFEWGDKLGGKTGEIYEKNKNPEIFRIHVNCTLVASKMISAIDYEPYEGESWQWRVDRIGYTLSLTSLNRCIKALEILKIEGFAELAEEFEAEAKQIRQGLMDRLDDIEQSRLSLSKKVNKKHE